MNLVYRFLQIFMVSFIVNIKLFWAFPVENGVYPLNRLGRLLIKPFPAIENLQSDLYEVFMEPYGYVSIKHTYILNFPKKMQLR